MKALENIDDSLKNADEYQLPIAEMYPDLTLDEQAEAEFYLTRYFEVIHSIFEEKHGLTSSDLKATFKHEK